MSLLITYSNCPCCQSANISLQLKAKDYTVSQQLFEIWQCANCSIRFTQYAPGQNSIAVYYQSENYISHTDTKKGFINALYHAIRKKTLRQKLRLIKKQTSLQAGNLLDIGAGTGAFTTTMQQAGWQVTALEPDAATRQKAQSLYNVTLQSIEELFQQPEQHFDAITMWHVLEHVHALHDYIAQIRKVLKPGGKAFIAVPNYTSYDAWEYKASWAAYDVPRHLYHFSPAAVKTLLKEHGLKLRAVKPMWYDSFYISMLSEQYRTGSSNHIRAFLIGLVSNLKTLLNTEKCSSLIYIIEKA